RRADHGAHRRRPVGPAPPLPANPRLVPRPGPAHRRRRRGDRPRGSGCRGGGEGVRRGRGDRARAGHDAALRRHPPSPRRLPRRRRPRARTARLRAGERGPGRGRDRRRRAGRPVGGPRGRGGARHARRRGAAASRRQRRALLPRRRGLALSRPRQRRRGARAHRAHLDRDPLLRLGQPLRRRDARLAAGAGAVVIDRRQLLRAGLALGAAGTGTAALAACAGTLPPIDTTADNFGAGATGSVTVWCRAATQTAIQAAAESFNALHDDLQVTVLPIPDAQYVTKLATSIRGGSVPVIVDFDLINCPLFSVREAFADITELVEALPFRDSLSAGHMGLASYEDRLYGIPFIGDYSTLFANTDLLARAGLALEEVSGSLESLLEACHTLKRELPEVAPWTFPGNASGAM